MHASIILRCRHPLSICTSFQKTLQRKLGAIKFPGCRVPLLWQAVLTVWTGFHKSIPDTTRRVISGEVSCTLVKVGGPFLASFKASTGRSLPVPYRPLHTRLLHFCLSVLEVSRLPMLSTWTNPIPPSIHTHALAGIIYLRKPTGLIIAHVTHIPASITHT